MTQPAEPERAVEGPAPMGSWPRVYLAVVLFAILVMVALYWFSSTYDIPLEAR